MMGNDDLLYEYVIDELEETSLIKGLWAKAIAHSEGNNDKAKSLYIQYRVQSIKDEFNSFGINYTELEKDKLFSIIKSGFKITEETNQIKVEQEEKIEVLKKLNEEKTNNEKYGKIKGWLIFFAFLLVLWNLSQFGFVQYFTDEYISAIQNMYLSENKKMVETSGYIFYSELFTAFILFLFTLSFFSKSKITKIVAICFFITIFIIKPIQFVNLLDMFKQINEVPPIEISKIIGSLLWAFIFLLYFIFSKRVKKTFIKETKVENHIMISAIIPIILFFYYTNMISEIENKLPLTKSEKMIEQKNNIVSDNMNSSVRFGSNNTAISNKIEKNKSTLNNLSSNELDNNINKFIEAIKIRDKYLIAEFIAYPLSLHTPLPSIKNKEEFVEKFDLLFDDYLLDEISNNRGKWEKIGIKGIMFKNGDVWFDSDGSKIIAINYITKKQQNLIQLIMNKEKNYIHQSLKNYSKPLFEVYTDKHRIRVDYLENGKYRYASWKIDKTINDKPDIILTNGTIEYNGNGGTYSLYFTNGEYKYVCENNQAFSIKSYLYIYKNDELLLHSELKFD
ncbi:DUF2569 family protein [Aliarcobacter cibarius]|uniref:DUF2569 family protein n=1 Tax=Aliarcobacter cibarius TaxID=255507 RepID=UPI0010FEB8A6|nr:DUF2569 family protein [Aliarcobacter cibarius]TLT03398.1 DUF2569 domain-containing protein [Aliarcobacter cibarius]